MNGALDEYDALFVALADASRRGVLERLVLLGEGSATAIAAGLPISRQAVMKHLAQLDRARLVDAHRVGREVRYRVRTDHLSAAADHLDTVAASWDRTLGALKRLAEADDRG